jgi:hypothetical protein
VGISERILPINYISYANYQRRLGDPETGAPLYPPKRIILDTFVEGRRFRPGDSIPPPIYYNMGSGVGWEIDVNAAYNFILIEVKDKNWEIIDDLKEPVLFLGAGIFFGNVDWRTLFPENGRSRKTLPGGAGIAQGAAVNRVGRRRWLSLVRREDKTSAEANDKTAPAEEQPTPGVGNDKAVPAEEQPTPGVGNDKAVPAEEQPTPGVGPQRQVLPNPIKNNDDA